VLIERGSFIHNSAETPPTVPRMRALGGGPKTWNNVQIRERAVIGERCIVERVHRSHRADRRSREDPERRLDLSPSLSRSILTGTLWRRGCAKARRSAPMTIVCGVELGSYCMVGAAAVVTKNVPPHAVVVGNSARLVGFVSGDGEAGA